VGGAAPAAPGEAGAMRLVFALLSMLALAQCATGDGDRFRVGEGDDALVIIGAAEAFDATESRYAMMWRRFDPADRHFIEHDDDDAFEAHTNADDTVRVDGIPGEFTVVTLDPGVYALDSVFGRIRDGRVDYIAQGIVQGPERPSFEVRAGEAVYLGIWQLRLDNAQAVAQLWRLDQDDLQAVVRATRATRGAVSMRETEVRDVTCAPRRLNAYSQREIC
jgi:hypothetical protein